MSDETEDDELDAGPDAVDPSLKPKSSKGWLKLITDQEKAGYADYQERCTNIQKRYADMARLASITRDREFQIFWANIEVLKPSMYSRPPVPVVAPRFQDRRPLPRTASELVERSTVVAFDQENMDGVMRSVRDDLAMLARGCMWLRYETKNKGENFSERVCIEHKNRRDFVHDPAREWKDVDWVAGGAWMTRKEMRKRFKATSGNAYQDAEFAKRKDDKNNSDGKLKARVWELWSKSENKVVWVSPGVDVVLDEGEPHLTLEGFFPCPQPAYGTVQPESLIPVPDYLFYKDQIEEINDITNRVSSLTDALRVRGFYPAGAGEIGDAIETALKSVTDRQVMIPVSNWAAFGNGAAKDTIVWLPLDMIATTITQLIALRKQLIDDIYQISGLSDIMRGETNPNETLGAQQIKTQYGSVRIRDRQNELVRIARDAARIAAEIMAENFQQKTLLDMSQMDLPTDADLAKQVKPLEAQAKAIEKELQQAQADPEIAQMAQQNPEAAQQIMQQAQGQLQGIAKQIDDLKKTVTIDQVMEFLHDQRIRAFSLDIETDSTIQPDENAEKQRRSEFLTALGGTLAQLAPMVQQRPETAPFAAELLKFAVAPFRPGRSMDAAIDEFADKMKEMAAQPQPQKPDPNAMKAEAEAKAAQQDADLKKQAAEQDMANKRELHAMNMQEKQAELEGKRIDARASQHADAVKYAADAAQRRDQRSLERIKLGLPDIEPPAPAPNTADSELLVELQRQNAAMMAQIGQFMQVVTQALTAPKRIVKGPDGKPIGVETVQPQQGMM
ncbi:hypothetical protein EOA60_09755 [Mesorhizobium sp. M1A.F.Ca.IN.020.06.1.1]|uniref:hypothetical protein n=1 Tax=unclassified Mesorhizobium TaxID=325217 RepID=UPI000FCBAEE7|nr:MULTISPECIES: hypothetical protein [unclassified Mesorhizobium]RUV90256.1 hypothetical protein EOA51_00625 [Mesorhizobium sp. M1A.F.Ca.IN.020.32.1.1]RUW12731.1 hypothetical protein EOA46_08460 [Mesorhizobium sp. M1A.F.Ca.IN.022.05.2.1]RUW32304.1 hypothetical protein EOA60_09755 [Mesorhizobium sp. M1A.F.Ca.IN.020.06.1.1]RWF82267.1 MAG: hypothetical protein EOQ35_10900 [Mesorhizobium sp.]RWG04188.1 MAG: hypothetical protein EOQ38_06515 [Mesorhizobium sp.]